MLPGDWQIIVLETEPHQPSVYGQYAVGPYVANTVEPSGSDPVDSVWLLGSYAQGFITMSTNDPASSCNTGWDGTEAAPAAVAAQGWWSGLLCGYGHSAWSLLSVKANRSLTVEVTAEDEQGFATSVKAMPVIGIWNATDVLGSLPGVASAGQAFNGQGTGMTTLAASFTQPDQLRIAIADQRGMAAPTSTIRRVCSTPTVSALPRSTRPEARSRLRAWGSERATLSRSNGVAATVSSWTANTIVATVPPLQPLGSTTALTADVAVTDLSTGDSTVMTQALSYNAPTALLSLLTAPVRRGPSGPACVDTVRCEGYRRRWRHSGRW